MLPKILCRGRCRWTGTRPTRSSAWATCCCARASLTRLRSSFKSACSSPLAHWPTDLRRRVRRTCTSAWPCTGEAGSGPEVRPRTRRGNGARATSWLRTTSGSPTSCSQTCGGRCWPCRGRASSPTRPLRPFWSKAARPGWASSTSHSSRLSSVSSMRRSAAWCASRGGGAAAHGPRPPSRPARRSRRPARPACAAQSTSARGSRRHRQAFAAAPLPRRWPPPPPQPRPRVLAPLGPPRSL
mmetsp:Transcript_25178/g.72191  ORF Transcript_25178/g.72191 Transcript_25178/m.72191 type:complete len:241 (+) Transcript_25178:1362-2084(+)